MNRPPFKRGGLLYGEPGVGKTSGLMEWLKNKPTPAFIVETANNIKQLPSEIVRKGRFDDIFPAPNAELPVYE